MRAVQVPKKSARIFEVALANVERGNQFRVRIDCDKDPLIADFRGIAFANVTVFLLDEGPNFVDLEMLEAKVPHPVIHERLAAFPGENQKPHDRVAV